MIFNNDNELRKWIKENIPYVEKTEEELKKEFIEEFGIDKWIEMEAEVPCDMLSMRLCNYLEIDSVPVLFEEMNEDARYYDTLNYIAINKKFIGNELEIRKSIIHEVKHLHQKHCISHKKDKLRFTTPKLIKDWEKDFKLNQRLIPIDELNLMSIEVDAYAFTKYILDKWFNYEYHYPNDIYDEILNKYIAKYYK
ncbi:MAG: hypothetical protein K6G28_04515 [Acholeplasmatales bacterium]|nr:hypothetical protein [Acholeplasmatales bacterium]